MNQTIAITEAITTLGEAEQRFGLSRNEDDNFFTEWQQDLPVLTEIDITLLADLRRRYIAIAKGVRTIKLVLLQTRLFQKVGFVS